MKTITMYTGPMCNFCEAAKRLFSRNNLKYQEIDISMKDGLRDDMMRIYPEIPSLILSDKGLGSTIVRFKRP